ncbi:TRAP transporter small permease [Rhodobacter sp. NTK016B]|uniref:TRAP transporter small permease n=1 Tax=Rhodobacter sp. NTK016B TaxID=2759676 RepID=UPI001A906FF6|nr:TRAP transporter small permease [Rhodobacter sp. NTK016B]MBN8293397.1 TRAP transporter small permease [Rhodobacter sp. NTK016B]
MNTPSDPRPRSRVSQLFLWIASVALVLMMLVVTCDVILRAVFNTPVQGAYDAVSILLLVMVAFGFAPVLANRGEIVIDLLDAVIGRRSVRLLASIAAVMTMAVMLFFAWSAIDPARNAWRYGDRSLELGIPQWAMWGVLAVGVLGILWAALVQVVSYWREGSE